MIRVVFVECKIWINKEHTQDTQYNNDKIYCVSYIWRVKGASKIVQMESWVLSTLLLWYRTVQKKLEIGKQPNSVGQYWIHKVMKEWVEAHS